MSIQATLSRCDAYCAATGMSPARLSTIIFGSGVTIRRLKAGASVTVRVLDRAAERLADLEAADNSNGQAA